MSSGSWNQPLMDTEDDCDGIYVFMVFPPLLDFALSKTVNNRNG